MSVYNVNALTAATAATIDHAIVQIWNPHATARITIWEVGVVTTVAPVAAAGFVIRRSTARGVGSASSFAPTLEHSTGRDSAPSSGFFVDLAAFTTQPTLVAGELGPAWVLVAAIGSGVILPIQRGLVVPPGTGIVLVNRAAIALTASEVSFVIED